MRRTLLFVIVAALIPAFAGAQVLSQLRPKPLTYNERIIKKYTDTLAIVRQADSLEYQSDVLNDPYFYPLLLSPTLYNTPISSIMQSPWKPSHVHEAPSIFPDIAKSQQQKTVDAMSEAMMWAYTNVPWLVTTTQKDVDDAAGIRKEVLEQPVKEVTHITPKEDDVDLGLEDASFKVITRRPNFWNFGGNVSFNLSQNYVSDNWYKGDERNNQFGVVANVHANYNNQRWLIFENNLNVRLNFVSIHKDKAHKYATNSDKTELVSRIGVSAIKHWYYSVSLDVWTQLYPKYASNSDRVTSDFLSPVEGRLGIGVTYKLNVKNFSLNADLQPLAYHAKYSDRKKLAPNFGIPAPHQAWNDFGPGVTINYNWRIAKTISTNGKLMYDSNYHYARVRFESSTNFAINRYLRTTLYLYPFFDDRHYQNGKAEFFQFKENLSLGISFSF